MGQNPADSSQNKKFQNFFILLWKWQNLNLVSVQIGQNPADFSWNKKFQKFFILPLHHMEEFG